jgi:hypothetical protein
LTAGDPVNWLLIMAGSSSQSASFFKIPAEGMDGRVKPGHDDSKAPMPICEIVMGD